MKLDIEGEESLAAYAALFGEERDRCRLTLPRREELAFAYGYYLGKGDEKKQARARQLIEAQAGEA